MPIGFWAISRKDILAAADEASQMIEQSPVVKEVVLELLNLIRK